MTYHETHAPTLIAQVWMSGLRERHAERDIDALQWLREIVAAHGGAA